jgi:hypothetical protein
LATACCTFATELLKVSGPDFWFRELFFERGEPVVVELDFAAFNELPCACVVRAFLDGEVDISNWNIVLDFVVKDGLKWTYDLPCYPH